MNKKLKIIIPIIIMLLILGGICTYLVLNDNSIKTDTSTKVDLYTYDEEIDWSKYKTYNIELTESLKITTGGVYKISGTLSDGNITIDTKDNVKLYLNGVSITSSNSPAIIVNNAKCVVIETAKDTENYLEDGSNYSSTYSDIEGTIYSSDDLVLEGKGTLEVKSNKGDAIVSKDNLKINSGTYKITSKDDGIRGKDSVYIKNGTFTITSTGDGIKSTNEKDSSLGYVYIKNGNFTINSTLDGISAITKLVIKDGEFDITTGGGSDNASTKNDWGRWRQNTTTDNTQSTQSAKGIKSDNNISISAGNFTLNTSDDAIHSNNYVEISKATLNISSGDDGIHADEEIKINSGTIDITKSYEGIEASIITINDGDIKVVASDDGINVANGNDSSNMGRPGENNVNTNTDSKLIVNGGKIYVNSTGDGIDINASGYIYGGEIIVEGPTDNGNAALDYDGEFVVDDGTVISTGSSGMLQGISSNSKQYNVMAYLNNINANIKISIVDSDGNEIISTTPTKTYSSLVVSTSKLQANNTYKILVDGEEYKSFTINSISTTVGSNSNGMQGGPGGMRGRR